MSGPDKETAARLKAEALRANLRRRKSPAPGVAKPKDLQETDSKSE